VRSYVCLNIIQHYDPKKFIDIHIVGNLLGVLYVFEITRLSVQGYKLDDLAERKKELQQENTQLSSSVTQKHTLEELEKSQITKQMKEADFTYIKGKDILVKR